jgi:hypothetical protein
MGDEMTEKVYDQREDCYEAQRRISINTEPTPSKQKWVCMMKWKNLSLGLLDYFSKMAKDYQKDTGRELFMRGVNDWSEIGYWE